MAYKDLAGRKFGRLTVKSYSHSDRFYNRVWLCNCRCGKASLVAGCCLLRGTTRSCGCLRIDANSTHGMYGTREYKSWLGAKSRCFNPKRNNFKNYGGRGITMSKRWASSFEAFMFDMGHCPDGYSIDRINNDGPYTKENCRWASSLEQKRNTRKQLQSNGDRVSLTELAEKHGIKYKTLFYRRQHGLPLLAPVRGAK